MPEHYDDEIKTTVRKDDGSDDFSTEKAKPGDLLRLPDRKAVKLLGRMWTAHDPFMRKRYAQWRVNDLRRQGVPGVALVKSGDDWDTWLAPGVSGPDQVPIVNKAAEICRKFVSIMLSDPPAPEAVPEGPSEEEILAAEVSTRVLEEEEGEARLGEPHLITRAFDKACTYASGFIHYFVDPEGGPEAPIEIEAHPFATHADTALVDPETGAPAEPPFVKRFVMEDGVLSPNKAGARTRTLPVLKAEVLTGRNVRLVPHTASDLWDAEGVMIGSFVPLVKLRARFPDVIEGLTEEDMQKMMAFRPDNAKAIAKTGQRLEDASADGPMEERDEHLVFVTTAYFKKGPDYPKGAVILTAGNCVMLHRADWSFVNAQGMTEALEIPLTQYAQFEEGDDEPYSHSLMELIGKANEARNTSAGAIIDAINRLSALKVFIPAHSMVSQDDLSNPLKRYISINQGGAPEYETPPPVPTDLWNFYGQSGEEMQQAPGLSDTAQGLESPGVKSGRQALAIVQQAHASLSSVKRNIERAYTRSGRIKLQLMRAFYEVPRSFGFKDDEMFKLESWSSADLGGTRDVKVRMGSLTMLTPAAKAQLAEHWFGLGLIPPDDMARISTANIGPLLGVQGDPFRMRIKRQLQEWLAGPPAGWAPPPPVPQMDPATGQLVPVPGPDPELERIFEAVPADGMPAVAQIRLTEISRTMSSARYLAKPREWRSRLDMEFQLASLAVFGQGPSPELSDPNAVQAASQSGSPAQQTQAKDMLGSDTDPAANSSVRLSDNESAQAGGNL